MGDDTGCTRVITDTNVQEYFHESIAQALRNQQMRAGETTVHYVVNLLACFTRADRLFDQTPEGMMVKPLASLYAAAVETPYTEERRKSLRRLGDLALFIAGVFSDSLNRKVIDVDYYVAMGGNAYGHLSESLRGTVYGIALGTVFGELSSRFQEFVDLLGEVSERANLTSDADIMRLYELWVRTGSKRAAGRLRKLGIQVAAASTSGLRH